jgi:2-oxoglutarate ferredoxin oxidoreductase subunit alpha
MGQRLNQVVELEDVVIRFAGDSGDGMQLTGSLFSDAAAFEGNVFATFPDYPSEIRAPQGTVAGVSGYQVHIGAKEIYTSGDLADVLVAMNPASLKSNLKWTKKGGIIIVDVDAFNEKGFERAGYESNPLEGDSLDGYRVIKAPITSLSRESLRDLKVDHKVATKSRNMFALGLMYYLFNISIDSTLDGFKKKFKTNPLVIEANTRVLQAGYNYADTIEVLSNTYNISPAPLDKGRYRNITGNQATAWGFLAAAEKAGRELFLGSYPITPASEILQELTLHKQFSARVFQAEDEIAGIVSAIGASYAGAVAVTTTSGPGLSLKSEAIGLAVMTELPLVIVDVQRGGPSTGLPTKSEQSDLLQALYGRNGEAPVIILAATSCGDCFYGAFEATKLALEHMTPVILLTDGYLANGSEMFRIPAMKDMPDITPPVVEANDAHYKPYRRDEEKLRRMWAIPGTEGLRHRVGGLEKADITGHVSHDPLNHQKMCELREEKVNRVARFLPKQEVIGEPENDLLVVSWGSTYGVILEAVKQMQEEGKKVSMMHLRHICPLPENVEEILGRFKKIIVCELNLGQMVKYLKINFPQYTYHQLNKVQGLPFMVKELTEAFNHLLEE